MMTNSDQSSNGEVKTKKDNAIPCELGFDSGAIRGITAAVNGAFQLLVVALKFFYWHGQKYEKLL